MGTATEGAKRALISSTSPSSKSKGSISTSSWESGFSTVTTGLTGLITAGTGLWGTIKGHPGPTAPYVEEIPQNRSNNTMLILVAAVIALIGILYFLRKK